MNTARRKLQLLALSASLTLPTASFAGGLWINEFGSPVMGRAGAGSEAGTDDASASLHNPASMTRVDGEQLMTAGIALYSSTEFDVSESGAKAGDGDGGHAGGLTPLASLFYVRPINDEVTFGTYVGGLTGAVLDYDDDWVGRYQATEVNIIGVAVIPSVALKVNDKLSLGFGLPIMYTELELKVAVPRGLDPDVPDGGAKIDGNDTVVTVNLSALYEFTADTRVGVYYNSKFEPSYSGDLKQELTGNSLGVDTDLTLSAKLYTGLTHEFNDTISGHLTLGWEDWSEMDDVSISTQSGGAALDRNWSDTYHYGIGINYKLEKDWKLNAGFAYDTSPVGKYDRTADMPIDRQIRYAFGLEHTLASDTSIAAQLVYVDMGDAEIETGGLLNPEGPTKFTGKYDPNHLVFFAVSANWKFGD